MRCILCFVGMRIRPFPLQRDDRPWHVGAWRIKWRKFASRGGQMPKKDKALQAGDLQ